MSRRGEDRQRQVHTEGERPRHFGLGHAIVQRSKGILRFDEESVAAGRVWPPPADQCTWRLAMPKHRLREQQKVGVRKAYVLPDLWCDEAYSSMRSIVTETPCASTCHSALLRSALVLGRLGELWNAFELGWLGELWT